LKIQDKDTFKKYLKIQDKILSYILKIQDTILKTVSCTTLPSSSLPLLAKTNALCSAVSLRQLSILWIMFSGRQTLSAPTGTACVRNSTRRWVGLRYDGMDWMK